MVSYMVGHRGVPWAKTFMEDVASRVASRVQITTDSHNAYVEAIEGAFGMDCDYAMLIKLYGNPSDAESRYSQGECIETERKVVTGNPDPAHISTSFVERANLTMRMSIRRFTRPHTIRCDMVKYHCALCAGYLCHCCGLAEQARSFQRSVAVGAS